METDTVFSGKKDQIVEITLILRDLLFPLFFP